MDISQALQEKISGAIASNTQLAISGGHSKDFYGREIRGEDFSVAGHKGIVDYDFRELVITARAGTTLSELNQALAENHQMLPFEPPAFADSATLGGLLACGFSGPRRPYIGSARDYLLGTIILNGKAEQLTFGGQVMKNVAGYDLSRLMVGAMGTLGVILQASIKVLPRPEAETTVVQQLVVQQAIKSMNQLAGKNIPLSASAYWDGKLYLRFSGVEASVNKAASLVGGDKLADAEIFWQSLKEHQHAFFQTDKTLWRLSLPPATPELDLAGTTFYEWGGAQRWFISDEPGQDIANAAALAGGHATQFRNGNRQQDVFQQLPDSLMQIHKKLKVSLDPDAIFNPGRLYQAF